MKTKDVKLNIDYKYKDETVKVIKRIKTSYVEIWRIGFGNLKQKIRHRGQIILLLSNNKKVFANELQVI